MQTRASSSVFNLRIVICSGCEFIRQSMWGFVFHSRQSPPGEIGGNSGENNRGAYERAERLVNDGIRDEEADDRDKAGRCPGISRHPVNRARRFTFAIDKYAGGRQGVK